MTKKFLLISTALLITISSFAQFSGGSGTEADPYKITTAQDLNNIRNYLGSGLCFKLMNDIDLTSFLSTTTTGWTPIGEYSKNGDKGIAFKGNFDGNGNTISGLWIDLNYPQVSGTNYNCVGLFGYMAYGNLQNLNVKTNSTKNIKCNNCEYVGILVGYKDYDYYHPNAFNSCSVKGDVYANGGTGTSVGVGLLGGLVTENVNACRAEGNVYESTTSSYCVGGLVGYSYGCNKSTFIGNVTTKNPSNSGLLSGIVAMSSSNCYAVGNLNVETVSNISEIGGFAGNAVIKNSYCSTNISYNNLSSNANIGSFIGKPSNNTSIQNNFYNSDICSLPPIGNQTNVPSTTVSGLTAFQMTRQANFLNWNFNTIWKIDEGVGMPYLQIIEKDATLSDLKVYQNQDTNDYPISLRPYSFNRDSLNYSTSQNLDYSVTEVTITGKTNYPKATVSGLGTRPLNIGNNSFDVVVTSQDGSVQHTYTVNVKRAANNNAKLSSLTVSEGTLSPSFNVGTQMYTVSVANSVSNIDISATPEDSNATVSGIGRIPLNVGQNYIYILVTAANGTSMTYYYVTVTREESKGFTITATAGENGSITPSGTITVNENENRTFAFTPNNGYKSQLVLIDGVANETAKVNGFYTFTNVATNHEILVTFAENTSGIEDVLENQITIYPNPTKEKIFIETALPLESIELIDLSGRSVASSTINNCAVTGQGLSLGVSSLPSGIYLLKVKTDKGLIVKKVRKE